MMKKMMVCCVVVLSIAPIMESSARWLPNGAWVVGPVVGGLVTAAALPAFMNTEAPIRVPASFHQQYQQPAQAPQPQVIVVYVKDPSQQPDGSQPSQVVLPQPIPASPYAPIPSTTAPATVVKVS